MIQVGEDRNPGWAIHEAANNSVQQFEATGNPLRTYSIAFVMERTMGHESHLRGLMRRAQRDDTVRPILIPIASEPEDRWWMQPIVRGNYSLKLSLRARELLAPRLRQDRPSAVFYHTQTTALFSPRVSRRTPVVISLDATPSNMDSIGAAYGHKPADDGPLDRLKHLWYCHVFRRADALVTWSEWARNSLIADYGVAPEKVRVIPPGVDLPRPTTRRAGPRAGSRLRLLFVGGDFKRKGGEVLLRAFHAGLAEHCELDIVTHDESVQGGGLVRVHRGLNPGDAELKRWFAEADLFVLPSLGDCSPIAIPEAMAHGLPVVSTTVGAMNEQVEHLISGTLVPPNDVAALSRAVSELVFDVDRRRAYSAASRTRAESIFNGDRNYQLLLDLIKGCVDARRQRESSPRTP